MARKKRPSLELEQFRYPDDLGLKLPQLVLGIHVPVHQFQSDYPPRDYAFQPGRKWLKLAHETAGFGRKPVYLVATVLASREAETLGGFASCWRGSNVGACEPSLSTLNAYSDHLKRALKVACNESHHLLAEGLYPIDTCFLPDVATDAIDPTKLDDLIEWDSGAQRAAGCVGRWSLAILARSQT